MNIGLIGLGNIGFHFRTRLLAVGFGLYVYDKGAEAQDGLVTKGAKPCSLAKAHASEVLAHIKKFHCFLAHWSKID